MTTIRGFRIVGALPSLYEIYSLFRHTESTRYVFVDSYTFRNDQLPSDDEYEILNKNKVKINNQIILTPTLIDRFGSRFLRIPNCIHVYDSVGSNISSEYITFKNLNWDWTYYCHDGCDIEIFIKNNHEEAYNSIKQRYNVLEVEFPDLIKSPGGFNIL